MIADLALYFQNRPIITWTEICRQRHIAQLDLGCSHQIDITVYATKTKHVLIFQVTAIRPTVNLDSYDIIARANITSNVEAGIIVSPLAVAYFMSIDPNIHCAVCSIEMQENILVFPTFRQNKIATVRTYCIGFL